MSLDQFLTNKVDANIQGHEAFLGIIGLQPDPYSKSPAMWKAAFEKLKLNYAYVAMNVIGPNLPGLFGHLKERSDFLGMNITVPHKLSAREFVRPHGEAERSGSINTIVRTREGDFIGHTTDGIGAVRSLTETLPDERSKPLFPSLQGMTIIIIGTGGACRAVAFSMAEAVGPNGKLFIYGRNPEKAKEISSDISSVYRNTYAILEDEEFDRLIKQADVITNTTALGQEGMMHGPIDGKVMRTSFEPYSALGPANPPLVKRGSRIGFENDPIAKKDIERNLSISRQRTKLLKKDALLFDLIYSHQTKFIQHGKESGHRTLDGRSMLIWQAVEAFKIIMGAHRPDLKFPEQEIAEVMSRAW